MTYTGKVIDVEYTGEGEGVGKPFSFAYAELFLECVKTGKTRIVVVASPPDDLNKLIGHTLAGADHIKVGPQHWQPFATKLDMDRIRLNIDWRDYLNPGSFGTKVLKEKTLPRLRRQLELDE